MWLLSTDRAELKLFASPDQVPGGYAVLSHVWDESDAFTFQHVQTLKDQSAILGASNPRDIMTPRVRDCCILAESHGHKWLWTDMCCINRESSAELSEAINSMSLYYSLSSICYAHLQDVPGGYFSEVYLQMPNSPFRSSIWHQRLWTLQALVVPHLVLFLSQDWKAIGTKAELSALLSDISGVPADVLRMEKDLNTVSLARRMSWAARRTSTRTEDEAYALMGIFGVNMPVCYGEGREAFHRLQEEIMRRSVDTSLFAWGSGASDPAVDIHSPPTLPSASCSLHDDDSCYLLASSPSQFANCRDIDCKSPWVRPSPVSSPVVERYVCSHESIGIPRKYDAY